jgi:hypothetical protein
MKTSDSQLALVGALFKAKGKFPRIAKNKEGQAGNRKFRYAPLDEINDLIDPVLRDFELMITQGTEGHELVTRLEHISGEWREIRMPVNAEHANMQSYGIEITYRRRYSVQLILGIVTEEDIDIRAKEKRKGIDHTEERNANGSAKAFSAPHKPTDGAMDALPQDQREYINELAADVQDVFKASGASEAFERVQVEGLDNDQMVALWSLLPSNVRSALKTEKGKRNAAS